MYTKFIKDFLTKYYLNAGGPLDEISEGKLGAILQTFSRYEYTVEEIYSDDEINSQGQLRYEHLMKYLNI